ncbi:MAG: hypothetical protein HN919_17705 [Verrucomicrobia bacterium]|nr:hypothetical protein [Verrucomicrobiota bacterium]MBT7068135.1 hypothetical protein [Verrucomicrobiota bacterium]
MNLPVIKEGPSGFSGEFSIEQSTDDGAIVTGGDKDRDYDRDYDGKGTRIGTKIGTKMGGVGVDENGVSFGLSVRIVSLLIVVSIVVPIVVIPS